MRQQPRDLSDSFMKVEIPCAVYSYLISLAIVLRFPFSLHSRCTVLRAAGHAEQAVPVFGNLLLPVGRSVAGRNGLGYALSHRAAANATICKLNAW